jgi:hypothetical protein
MIRLTVRSDAFGSTRKGLAGNDYRLANMNCLSLIETCFIYCIADPSEGD